MAATIDGKTLAQTIRAEIQREIRACERAPKLAVILVGEDPSSVLYVRNKEKACHQVGINVHIDRLPAATSERALLERIHALNEDPGVDGILVQMPLPSHIEERDIISAISPHKDVDGFHPINLGKLLIGEPGIHPPTPSGIIEMLDRYDVHLEGKRAVVIGRSLIVGKPMALMLLERNATVTVCHSRTQDLASIVREADVLVVAVGKAHLVQPDWVKPGAVVIDVGQNRLNGQLTGDVHPDAAKHASMITPVPGGVGPMTIAMLLSNTLKAYQHRA